MNARLARVVAIALAVLASGCGDRVLWDRWQAERLLWLAERASERAGRGSEALRALEPAYERIVAAYPAARWSAPARQAGPARDVAEVAARAQGRLATLALDRGDAGLAADRAERLASDWAVVPDLAALGFARLAQARIRLGDEAGAQAALEAVLTHVPLVSEHGFGILRVAAEAPLDLARLARARGDEPAAQSALLRAEARAIEAMAHAGPELAAALADLRWQYRAARGDVTGALAMGHALALQADEEARLPRLLDLAHAALGLGQPESALVYARIAEEAPGRRLGAAAMLVRARAHLAVAEPESALTTLDRLAERWYDIGTLSPEARFLRAEALAALGREEAARAERKALVAAHPAHALAFRALQRIVAHHTQAGQGELARLEGAQALETIDRTLAHHRDPGVQRDALRTRSEILDLLGRRAEADSATVDLFVRFPDDSAVQARLLEAADRWPAASADRAALWRLRIASRSMSPELRARARRGLPEGDAR